MYIYLHNFYSRPNVYRGDQIKARICWRNMQNDCDKKMRNALNLESKKTTTFQDSEHMFKTCKTPDFTHFVWLVYLLSLEHPCWCWSTVGRELQKMYRSRGLEANREVEIIRVMLKEWPGEKEVMVLATGGGPRNQYYRFLHITAI
jgi:hypothetical protein